MAYAGRGLVVAPVREEYALSGKRGFLGFGFPNDFFVCVDIPLSTSLELVFQIH